MIGCSLVEQLHRHAVLPEDDGAQQESFMEILFVILYCL